MSLPTIFDTCRPRADVLAGAIRDDEFMADLSRVVNGTAPADYLDPAAFFAKSYPTRGMKELLKAVCLRLSGQGGEVSSIIRLGTQYGGGKTHSLIALVHAVRGMKGVPTPETFVDPAILPAGAIRIAALDGENADPANGLTLEPGLLARSLWGEMAYRLAGRAGYERVRVSDEKHIAPGADTIRELFGGQPTLILLDEISVYLRKVERAFPDASKQFAAFVHDLFKAVASTPRVALVYTLAIGKDDKAGDAYKEENERAAAAMSEAESVAVRSTTPLNPTEEDETPNVLRARLFESVDLDAAQAVIAAYAQVWNANRVALPADATDPELRDQFARSYPLHPKLLEMLTEKTASLSTFQRTRGMLRLLARTVHYLWRLQPPDASSIHAHHMDPAFEAIRTEINVKLGQGQYAPVVKSDVAAVTGDEPALAQRVDAQRYPGLPPVTSYVARTIFWHTLAYGDSAKGITAEQLKLSVCSPALEPPFVEQARVQFVTDSIYLDDRPGAPLRFMVEPNLTMIVRRMMRDIDAADVRTELSERIRQLFSLPRGEFNAVLSPAGPYEVPDEVGDGRPLLVVINHESTAVPSDLRQPPPDVAEIFECKGTDRKIRELKNNLVFVAADERAIPNMRDLVRRRLALGLLQKPEHQIGLADYQQGKVKAEYEKLKLDVAMAILQCYRHLFYPSSSRMTGAQLDLGHTILELSGAGDSPGNGQHQVERVLHEQKKLLEARDIPDSPPFVRDQTGLRVKGEMTTAQMRTEYRRAPKLSILLHDAPLFECIRNGIDQGVFIYREGSQVWGPGDPRPIIHIGDNHFLHTIDDAKAKKLWPRAEPLELRFQAHPNTIERGGSSELVVSVKGGVPPYTYTSNEPQLAATASEQATQQLRVRPEQSMTYTVEVTDSRGQRQQAIAVVTIREKSGEIQPPVLPGFKPAEPPPPELTAQGPLAQALADLWDKARKAKVDSIASLRVRLFEAGATWKVHQAMATLQEADVTCHFEVGIEADGVEQFEVNFTGRVDKANAVKSFLDPQIRAATDTQFEASYSLAFKQPLSLQDGAAGAFSKRLTQYGGGEAFVEAIAGKV
ncbi:MAG: ATP-binding protein [Acidobacteria bacterium]|nr:ATP-binding protein [Acidobacteriota bacterium]